MLKEWRDKRECTVINQCISVKDGTLGSSSNNATTTLQCIYGTKVIDYLMVRTFTLVDDDKTNLT